MEIIIPGEETPFIIKTLILDLNGTIAIDGKVIEGVAERIELLRKKAIRLFLFTGDTHGNGAKIAEELGLELRVTKTRKEKMDEAMKLDAGTCAAIGNGRIDADLFEVVRHAIIVCQAEGMNIDALLSAKIQFNSINDALDSLLIETRTIGTQRQ